MIVSGIGYLIWDGVQSGKARKAAEVAAADEAKAKSQREAEARKKQDASNQEKAAAAQREQARKDEELKAELSQMLLILIENLNRGRTESEALEVAGAEVFARARVLADKSDPVAETLVGLCLKNGQGVSKNESAALARFLSASKRSGNFAKYMVWFYADQGVSTGLSQSEVLKYLRDAAEDGIALAQLSLSFKYFLGEGVAQDSAQGLLWATRSAEQNNVYALCTLGLCYALGEYVKQDYTKAVFWYRKAAELGRAEGQFQLGICYWKGLGVTKDLTEARRWLLYASKQGHKEAGNALDELNAAVEKPPDNPPKPPDDKPREVPGVPPAPPSKDTSYDEAATALRAATTFRQAFDARSIYREPMASEGRQNRATDLDALLQTRLAALDSNEFKRISALKATATSTLKELGSVLKEYALYLSYSKCANRVAAEKRVKELEALKTPILRNPENFAAAAALGLPKEYQHQVSKLSTGAKSRRFACLAASKIIVVDLELSKVIKSVSASYDSCFAISPDGNLLAWESGENQANVLDLRNDNVVSMALRNITAIAFSDDSKKVVVGGYGQIKQQSGNCAVVFDATTGKELTRTDAFQESRIESVGFLGSGRFFTFDTGSQTIAPWSTATV